MNQMAKSQIKSVRNTCVKEASDVAVLHKLPESTTINVDKCLIENGERGK